MSEIVRLTESASLILNGTPLADLAEGDAIVIAPVNPHSWRVNSARGGVTVGKHLGADVRDVTIRVEKGSQSDVQLNSWLNSQDVVLLEGSAKETYIRDGQTSVESYTLTGGSLTTQPTNTKNNTDGNEVMEYVMQFRTAKRSL